MFVLGCYTFQQLTFVTVKSRRISTYFFYCRWLSAQVSGSLSCRFSRDSNFTNLILFLSLKAFKLKVSPVLIVVKSDYYFSHVRPFLCLSVCPQISVAVTFDTGDFYENESPNLVKIGQKYCALYMKT